MVFKNLFIFVLRMKVALNWKGLAYLHIHTQVWANHHLLKCVLPVLMEFFAFKDLLEVLLWQSSVKLKSHLQVGPIPPFVFI